MKKLKTILLSFLFLTQLSAFSQFTWAQIGVDGLTCSACTRSVEMSIRKLDFVDNVTMNLEHTDGKIIFKKGVKVEIDKIAKAVVDAGFSLRSLHAGIMIEQLKVSNDLCWTYENDTYHFVKIAGDKELSGVATLQFIGEKYMAKKEFKKWILYLNSNCNIPTLITSAKIFYVTLL